MPTRIDFYEFVRALGNGGSGVVELWKKKLDDEELVVAKKIYIGDMTKGEMEEAKQEGRMLKRLKHPNIVKFHASWVHRDSNDLIIVQQYCPGGDLAAAIRQAVRPFSFDRIFRWFAELTHALQYCLKLHKIVHRDLKPSNVFLSEDSESVRLGDFGIARALGSTASLCQTFIGTTAYMCPEVVRMQSYGPKSDVWGLGAIFYEVCTFQKLYSFKNMVELMKSIADPTPAPSIPSNCGYPFPFQELNAAMLIKDATKRPSLDKLLTDNDFLRSSVLDLERDIGWTESLVPLRAEPEETKHKREKLLSVFRRFDRNGDGIINSDEMVSILSELDAKWDREMASKLLDAADAGNGPDLRYEDFVTWLLAESVDEWTDWRQAVLGSVDDADEDHQPSVVERDGSEHALGRSWGHSNITPAPASSLADYFAEAQERIYGAARPSAEPLPTAGEMASKLLDDAAAGGVVDTAALIHEAAEVTDLVELTLRKREFKQALNNLPVPDFREDPLCSHADTLESSAIQFESWSVKALKEHALSLGGSLHGITEKPELVALCQDLQKEKHVTPPQEMDELQKKAAVVDARIQCIDFVQKGDLDALELSIALRQAKLMKLVEEPCGVALVAHSHRLCMRAEDIVSDSGSRLDDIEEAAAVLEAAKRLASMLGDESNEKQSSKPLEHANQRMQQKRQQKQYVGIRSVCGAFVKLLSVPQSSALDEVKQLISQRWGRPVENFSFHWQNGDENVLLQEEENWQRCLQAHRKGSIEIQMRVVRLAREKKKKKTQRTRNETEEDGAHAGTNEKQSRTTSMPEQGDACQESRRWLTPEHRGTNSTENSSSSQRLLSPGPPHALPDRSQSSSGKRKPTLASMAASSRGFGKSR